MFQSTSQTCPSALEARLLRKDGSVLARVDLPVSQPTSVAFGGPDLRTLFITSASDELSREQLAAEPLAGGLFAVEVEQPGLPAAAYGATYHKIA